MMSASVPLAIGTAASAAVPFAAAAGCSATAPSSSPPKPKASMRSSAVPVPPSTSTSSGSNLCSPPRISFTGSSADASSTASLAAAACAPAASAVASTAASAPTAGAASVTSASSATAAGAAPCSFCFCFGGAVFSHSRFSSSCLYNSGHSLVSVGGLKPSFSKMPKVSIECWIFVDFLGTAAASLDAAPLRLPFFPFNAMRAASSSSSALPPLPTTTTPAGTSGADVSDFVSPSFLGRYFSTYRTSCSQIAFSSSHGSRFASSSSLSFSSRALSSCRALSFSCHSACRNSRTYR
mmetsp:Transcript_16116/g.26834  ORF Transcript_16116/g.26834 Transcript_16116/m.26834 type:complete len:295 (+) Transcript_16116:321-1205(+)